MTAARERREFRRFSANETLCAVFDSGAFGQLIDISKNGLSVLMIGATKLGEQTALDIFRLCGTTLVDSLQCEVVRRAPVRVSERLMANQGEFLCLNFIDCDGVQQERIEALIQQFSYV